MQSIAASISAASTFDQASGDVRNRRRALDGIAADGFGDAVSPEGIATLSPYQTEHINRFGDYVLDMSMPPAPLPFTPPQHRQTRRQTTEAVDV